MVINFVREDKTVFSAGSFDRVEFTSSSRGTHMLTGFRGQEVQILARSVLDGWQLMLDKEQFFTSFEMV